MTTSWSTNYGYGAAQDLTGNAPILVRGDTFPNKDWLRAQGGRWDKNRKTWALPIPKNNKDTAALLYGITSRKMEWSR